MCGGGFICSKNALTALNILYIASTTDLPDPAPYDHSTAAGVTWQAYFWRGRFLGVVVGFILISAALLGRGSAWVTNLPIVSGILGCGVVLIMVSVLGLFGAIKHNQVMLFFYMIILFLIFVVQFIAASACLTVERQEREKLAEEGWRNLGVHLKKKAQEHFNCCGFDDKIHNKTDPMGGPECNKNCCMYSADCHCPPCNKQLQSAIDYAFKQCGLVGLFFSITEFVGVWLTVRYRNQKDPRGNPSAFL